MAALTVASLGCKHGTGRLFKRKIVEVEDCDGSRTAVTMTIQGEPLLTLVGEQDC